MIKKSFLNSPVVDDTIDTKVFEEIQCGSVAVVIRPAEQYLSFGLHDIGLFGVTHEIGCQGIHAQNLGGFNKLAGVGNRPSPWVTIVFPLGIDTLSEKQHRILVLLAT